MKKKLNLSNFLGLLLVVMILNSCTNETIDEEKPTLTVNYEGGFPKGCELLTVGQIYQVKAMTTDNLELASYSVEVHHNFDHHTHDDQVGNCILEEIKSPTNPFAFSTNGQIPQGSTNYELEIDLIIPDGVDTGDYHLALSVTDVTGWQARTSVDIKIVE